MHEPIQLTNTIPSLRNSISPAIAGRGFLLIAVALALASFALSPAARAVTLAPDGGYPNQNTAEGDNALLNLSTGSDNTGIDFAALQSNAIGRDNTANGWQALVNNTTSGGNIANGEDALQSNTTGVENTATGAGALRFNTQ
jgi:hypothetical protein